MGIWYIKPMTDSPARFTLLDANWKDLGSLRQIEKECFGDDAWPLIDLIAVLTFPGIVRIKAVVSGEMVGFISGDGSRDISTGWITSVGVLEKYRRMGIANALLDACEARLPNRQIKLTVRKSNQSAINLYRKTGYVQTELWERYYQDGESGIVMLKVRPI